MPREARRSCHYVHLLTPIVFPSPCLRSGCKYVILILHKTFIAHPWKSCLPYQPAPSSPSSLDLSQEHRPKTYSARHYLHWQLLVRQRTSSGRRCSAHPKPSRGLHGGAQWVRWTERLHPRFYSRGQGPLSSELHRDTICSQRSSQ